MKKIDRRIPSALLAMTASALALGADAPGRVEPTAPDRTAYLTSTPYLEVVEKEVPPLQHARADRWPMIMWHGVGFAPLAADQIQMLLARGLTQHLRLDQGMIDAAKALQEAGSPVIFMQGDAGAWPYSLAADSSAWAHQFDAGYHYEMAGRGALGSWHGACPKMIEGWEIMADQVRDTLGAFRAGGVTVDAVWMDWEGDPYPWSHLFKQLAHCQRCPSATTAGSAGGRRPVLGPITGGTTNSSTERTWQAVAAKSFPCAPSPLAHSVFHSDQTLALLCQ